MTATPPTGIRSGVGFRNVTIFALNSAGLPNAGTMASPYAGIRISGVKAPFTISDPEPRRIAQVGDDTLLGVDVLPPQDVLSGELHTSQLNDPVDAILTGQKAFNVGTAAMFGEATNLRGYENQVGLIAYRQALDMDASSPKSGARDWDWRIMPKATLITREAGFADQGDDHIYSVIPSRVSNHLWGVTFTLAVEGFLTTFLLRGQTVGKPTLLSAQGDGTTLPVTFPVAQPAINTDCIVVTKNGVALTTGFTKTVTAVTFTVAPAATDQIVIFYES